MNAQPPRRPADRESSVVLLSGGLDSSVMTGLALARGERLWPLYARQGFLWEDGELAAVHRFLDVMARRFPGRLEALTVAALQMPPSPGIEWAHHPDYAPPDATAPDDAVYLPGRNLALLTLGALHAQAVGVARVQIGVLPTNPFIDAGDGFIDAFETATRRGLGWEVRIERPVGAIAKSELLERGRDFPLQCTMSCIRPEGGRHCGRCNKCAERMAAFARAGLADPADYATMMDRRA